MNAPPRILRIKRKRGQDPLQALILEDRRSVKRSKFSTPVASPATSPTTSPTHSPRLAPQVLPENFYFKLSRTDDLTVKREDEDEDMVIQSVLAEAQATEEVLAATERKFVIPKKQIEEDTLIPNELSDMLQLFLSVEQTQSNAENDYVYDVYYLDSEPLTSANHPQSQIGYIRFFDDEDDDKNENLLKAYNLDKDDDGRLSDDEDSNAEDFYQNDYPQDEDAEAMYDRASDSDSFHLKDGEDDEYDFEKIRNHAGGIGFTLEEDDYEDYGDVSYLADDQFEPEDDEPFKRNNFFASDEHDESAIHRDRIFGRLEKMIADDDDE